MEENSLCSDSRISVMRTEGAGRPTRPYLGKGQVGQLVASSVATGSSVISCLWAWIRSGALGDAWRRRGHGPSGPSPLCWQHCCGGGLLPSPGPMSAPGWGTPACAVLAMCTNKPPQPESLASPWALGMRVGQSDTWGCPQPGHRELCPSLAVRFGDQEAEPKETLEVIWSHPALCRETGGS